MESPPPPSSSCASPSLPPPPPSPPPPPQQLLLQEPNALLRDLYQKKQNIKRIAVEVGSMASELRDVRSRLAAQDALLHHEKDLRQIAEAKAVAMEKELLALQRSVEERSAMAMSTASVAEQYLRELVDVRAKLGCAQEVAESRAIAAATAESQCASLMKEIESQGEALQGHEARSADLARQMLGLRQELRCKEASEQQLREEMERLGVEMKLAIAAAASQNHGEMSCALEGFLQRSSEHLSKGYVIKDEEISRLRDEIRLLSLQLKAKAQELDAQKERHLTTEQDLKKRILKLEFWLQEARAQTRKLQKIVEKREKEIKDLRSEMNAANSGISPHKKGGMPAIWSNPKFRLLASLSAAFLLFCAKR